MSKFKIGDSVVVYFVLEKTIKCGLFPAAKKFYATVVGIDNDLVCVKKDGENFIDHWVHEKQCRRLKHKNKYEIGDIVSTQNKNAGVVREIGKSKCLIGFYSPDLYMCLYEWWFDNNKLKFIEKINMSNGISQVIKRLKEINSKQTEKKESELKPFSLEAALRGEPVVTKNGLKVMHFNVDNRYSPDSVFYLKGSILGNNGEVKTQCWDGNGWFWTTQGNNYDLFMAPKEKKKKKYWGTVERLKDGRVALLPYVFESEFEAICNGMTSTATDTIKAISFEVEE